MKKGGQLKLRKFSFFVADRMLQLILTQGKGMTVSKMKTSDKQEFHSPINFHYIAEQHKMCTIANN
jgi:hypothetical protein